MPNESETEVVEETVEQTPAEKAAAEKVAAAEARAQAAEEAAALLKSEKESSGKKNVKTSYTMSDFSEAEWAAAESETGKDRKQLLGDINFRAGISHQTNSTIESMQAQQAVKDDLQDALDADPLSPKFKAEVKKFIADLPGDILKTAEGRKKWIAKAIAFGKSQVKLPTTGRKPDSMDTRESGSVKDKGTDAGFSVEEKQVIEGSGKTVEDYKKIAHPFIKDGSIHKTKDEAPKFGPR